MNELITKVLIVLVCTSFSFTLMAQDTDEASHDVQITIPEVAILDLETNASPTITLGATAPTEAGSPIDFSTATNDEIWLNYSSIVGTGETRTVTVLISSGTVPSGVNLKLTAAADAGSGAGTVGAPGSELTLDGTPKTLISGIGSCYTETGVNNGHQLTYALELSAVADYNQLLIQNATPVTVTYTITD